MQTRSLPLPVLTSSP